MKRERNRPSTSRRPGNGPSKRWDKASHYPKVASFPHHLHDGSEDNVVAHAPVDDTSGCASGRCNALNSERGCIREGASKTVAQCSFTIVRVAQKSPQATIDRCRQESAVAQSALSAAWLPASSTLRRGVLYRLQSADPPG